MIWNIHFSSMFNKKQQIKYNIFMLWHLKHVVCNIKTFKITLESRVVVSRTGMAEGNTFKVQNDSGRNLYININKNFEYVGHIQSYITFHSHMTTLNSH